ncbi:hypothetical protein [Oryzomicrobium sp.]|uniref:hypothetical protein n=1 Tax=Oryzomicrobium sp. TaxID=1911578 RepID=UPI002FDFEE32
MTTNRLAQAIVLPLLAAVCCLPLPLASAPDPARPAAAPAAAKPAPPAGQPGCEVGRDTFAYLTPDDARQVQIALAYFGLYGNRIDGIVGIDTRAGLAAYCGQQDMTIGRDMASRQALVAELLRDAAIDRVFHKWRGIVASRAFAIWQTEQKDADQIPPQIKSGSAAQVIDIIDRFLKYQPAPGTAGRQRWLDDQGISYQLLADDFQALASRQEALAALAVMKDAGFQEQEAFSAQVRELLQAQAGAWSGVVQRYAESMSVFSLTPQGMARLKAARVPAYLLDQLGELEDPGYPSRAAVEKALQEVLAGIDQELAAYRAKKLAVPAGAPKTAAAPAAPAVPTPAAAAGDGGASLPGAGGGSGLADEVSLRLQGKPMGTAKERADSLSQACQEVMDEARKWLPLILAQVDDSTAYRLSTASWNRLLAAAGAVPSYALPMLDGMEGVDYPLRGIFLSAVQGRIGTGLKGYAKTIQGEVAGKRLTQLDDKFFAWLKANKIPEDLAGTLQPLKGRDFATPRDLLAEIDTVFQAQRARVADYQDFLADQARKRHVPDPAKPVEWQPVPDCKCRPKKMEKQVYGFYPFWLAGESQSVDFSVLSRIGYYAVGFDDSGTVSNAAHWNAASSQVFETARKYRTQVDLVVRRSDWSSWALLNREKRVAAFAALAGELDRLLFIAPTGAMAAIRPYLSLGTDRPSLGNGVTLFFEHYPEDPEFIEDFKGFLVQLHGRLAGRGQFVNLMLPSDALGQGIFNHAKLLQWADLYDADARGKYEADRMLILVLLREPTTDDKKLLRRSLEENLKGDDRRNLQRMTVPVIVPDGRARIDDDVIYMGDNFNGIGFWRLPTGTSGLPADEVLKNEFYPTQTNQSSAVCGIVCPNRWLFRLAFDCFLVVSLAFLVAFAGCCECRGTFRRHFLWFLGGTVVPLFVIGMAMLYCDPALESIAEGNGLLFLVLLGIIVYAVWDYQQKKQQIP